MPKFSFHSLPPACKPLSHLVYIHPSQLDSDVQFSGVVSCKAETELHNMESIPAICTNISEPVEELKVYGIRLRTLT